MKRILLLILVFIPLSFIGQDNGSTIVGAIDGNISVSMLGGAVYSIPLEIPEGVNNMQPNIGIVYNSQGGNGLLGYGWNISGISTINRTGSTLFHNGKMTAADFSADDQFTLDGQLLILVGNNGNNYEYKTENDEFSKIIIKKENGYYSKCEVRMENGNIIKYGYTTDSKLLAADGNNVIKWMASSIEDRNGNTISYLYETAGANSDIYVKQISYTSNTQAGLDPQFVVSFTYSSNRFDNYHYYIGGNKVLCDRLLSRIDIKNGNETIESYGFTYDGNSNRMYNLLKRISLSKGDYELNNTVIQWNTVSGDINNNELYSQEIDTSIINRLSFVGDFNGDGYSDLLSVPYKPSAGYTTNDSIKVYLNDMNGGFDTTPDYKLLVADSLDWIHVLDINGDGYDDFVLQTLVTSYVANYITYSSSFVVYESQQGNGFSNVNSCHYNNRLLVKTGDFFGEGRNGLLLMMIDVLEGADDTFFINGYPSFLHYNNGYVSDVLDDFIIDMGVVAADDFDGDGKTELMVMASSYITKYSFHYDNNLYGFTSTSIDGFVNYDEASYYTGDFNNDGKADLIFNDRYNGKYIALSTGTGFTDMINVNNTSLNSVVFPRMSQYNHSLSNVNTGYSYGINFSDMDGDGKTDLLYYNGNKKPVFYRNVCFTDNNSFSTATFKIEYIANNEDIVFENQFFTIGNFLGKSHVSFIAIDPNSAALADDDEVKVFSFPSTGERFSVSSITDGMGKTTEIEYGYLMPGNPNLYSFTNRAYVNDMKPQPMPMLAMKRYMEHVGANIYETSFKYRNAIIHKTGRGFVNFESVEKTKFINNSAIRKETSCFETTTMGANAVALPSRDSVFLYNNGVKVLSETNEYTFQNVRCDRQQTSSGLRLITRPAMTLKKTKRFNPDVSGGVLSVEIDDYAYSYSNGIYSNSYNCTRILTGHNGSDCNGFYSCEHKLGTQFSYKNNDYANWIINRMTEETTNTIFANKPSITKKKSYEYSTARPFLVTSFKDAPKATGNNPLTVLHEYQHDACGNVISETVSAPYGTLNEIPIVTNYTYGNYRLVTSKTVDPNGLAYQDQYSYDIYDRVTSHTGCSGLVTSYSYGNTFSTKVTTTSPNNVVSVEKTDWANGSDLAPSSALYMKTSIKTGHPTTTIFYDASGNAVRTTTQNHELAPVIVDVYYNQKNLPTQQTTPYLEGTTPQWTTFQYDWLGRLTATTTPDGTVVSNVYDGLTTTTTTTAGNIANTTEHTVNYLGWVTSNIDASGSAVTYEYYSDGKPEKLITSGGGVKVEMLYDVAGNRVGLKDPDYGLVTSVYDAFGRLIEQVTPKNHQFEYSYDVFGRVTQKTVANEGTVSYLYNENTNKGTLASVTYTGQLLEYSYDIYDRLTGINETRSDTSYYTGFGYDGNSKISDMTYPSGYKVYYDYFPNGTKKNVKDVRGNILWQTNDINALGQLVRATTGNGAVTTNTYSAATHRLAGSCTSNGIQNFAYTFDGFGNLTSRTDSIGGVKTESFAYDNIDRLTGVTLNNVSSSVVYDSYGRMISKQKDGSTVFESAQFSGRKPHAVSNVSTTSTEFPSYQTVDYNASDKVKRIAQDTKIVDFTYGYDAQRIRMTKTDTLTGRTLSKDYVGGCEFVDNNGSKKVYTYLMGPYGVFAVVVCSGGADAVHYVYKDHLGSWTTITDSVGSIVERRSFDAWGNLRDATTWSGAVNRTPKFDRGFTGHEHIYDLGLINMNGRMYDPLMSSFLSPDNYMQDPTTQQGFNRYAYCMYNPLKYVDPSGEQYFGWDPGLAYRMEQEARGIVLKIWNQTYDMSMASHNLTIAMANSLFSHGQQNAGNGSGKHGSPGGSVEVKSLGNGKYQTVNGLNDGGNTVYIVDDQGNRIGVLGYTLTPYTFYNEKGVFVKNAIIDMYDYSGQFFLDEFTTNPPDIFTYKKDIVNGDNGTEISLYNFKAIGYDKKNNFELYIYRSMPVNFGDGLYIATARDIGNFAAGYLCGISGFTYLQTRILCDGYQYIRQHNIEPPVSQLAQDCGYYWGNRFFSRTIQIPFYY